MLPLMLPDNVINDKMIKHHCSLKQACLWCTHPYINHDIFKDLVCSDEVYACIVFQTNRGLTLDKLIEVIAVK